MSMNEKISGFSKLNKDQKIEVIIDRFLSGNRQYEDLLKSYWYEDSKVQKSFDEFSENTISNFHIPFGVAPNFLINDKFYFVPLVIEESSVVAAASKAANFWYSRGGFKAEVLSFKKMVKSISLGKVIINY